MNYVSKLVYKVNNIIWNTNGWYKKDTNNLIYHNYSTNGNERVVGGKSRCVP